MDSLSITARGARLLWRPAGRAQSGGAAPRPAPAAARRRLSVSAGLFDSLFPPTDPSRDQQPEEEEAPTSREGSTMRKLDADSSSSLDGGSEEPFGPLAMLLVGFPAKEARKVKQLMMDAGGDEVQVLTVTGGAAAAAPGTLGAALEGQVDWVREVASAMPDPTAFQQQQTEEEQAEQQRVIFLSGCYASEVMEILAIYQESGLPPVVFAAAVPNNWERPLGELVQDVCADHAAMQAQQAAARRAGGEQAGRE